MSEALLLFDLTGFELEHYDYGTGFIYDVLRLKK